MKYPTNVSDHNAIQLMMQLMGVEEIYNGNVCITVDEDDIPILVGFIAIKWNDDNEMVAWRYVDNKWEKIDGGRFDHLIG